MTSEREGFASATDGRAGCESCRTFLAATHAGVCETDAEGVFLDASERFCELVGRGREQLIGKLRFADVIYPEDCSKDLGLSGGLDRGAQPFSVELRYLRPDDARTWAAVFANWAADPHEGSPRWHAVSIDITERKHSEHALRSSEARLAAIFDHAPVGLSELSLDGRVLRVNDELCNMLGRSREELLRMNAADVTHPDDVEHTRSVLAALVEKGVPGSLDKRYLRPDGEIVFANSSVSRLDDEEGRPEVILAVTVDLTERHRFQSQLAADLEAGKRLQEVSTRLISSGGAQDLFEELISAAVNISGADCGILHRFDEEREQLSLVATWNMGEALRRVCTNEAQDSNSAAAAAMRRKRRVTIADYATDSRYAGSESAQQYLHQSIRATQLTPLVARSGHSVGLISTHWCLPRVPADRQLRLLDMLARQAADLIERHQAEAALLESEERYRTLFNSIDEGFCIIEVLFDPMGNPVDTRFLQVNPAFERHSGLRNVVGKRQRELLPGPEPEWAEIFGRIAQSGEPRRFVSETRSLGRWFDVYAFRFGEPRDRQVAAVFSDITERVHEQAELRQADRRKNEFLAVLAHELRNPLAPIRSGLQVLSLSPGTQEHTQRLLDLMERQMQQMVRLVDDLLDLSRITEGKIHIQPDRASLRDVLDSAVEGSRPSISGSRVTLNVEMPAEVVELEVDAVRLAQVFSNLLNNAAKYTDAGGQIWLRAEVKGSDLLVRVRDTGEGIPPEMLQRVFDPFTQLDNTVARRRGGLGLGLSLVQTLVQLHGGTVSAHSEGVGKGSEFTVYLPSVVRVAEAAETRPTPEGGELAPHQVLVIDDNADAADALAMMLRMIGNEVQVAYGGEEGIARAKGNHPDLLLVDLGMPDLDGYEVVRRIRSEAWGQTVVVSALTGWGQEEDRQRSREAGFDYHLVKPVDMGTLRDLLSDLPPTEGRRH